MKSLLVSIVAAVLLVGCGGPSVDIWTATAQGNIESVKRHLDSGVDVNAKNKAEMTPLHYASMMGHKEVSGLLITNGADVNAKSQFQNFGETPLHHAAWGSHKEIVVLLITKGADVNEIIQSGSFKGMTPLDRAERQKKPELADLLRKHGGKTGEELKAEGK
tara:strand:- start:435 stop:920 length:486 start_codon:yes stop_codon:yes gene_type:complete